MMALDTTTNHAVHPLAYLLFPLLHTRSHSLTVDRSSKAKLNPLYMKQDLMSGEGREPPEAAPLRQESEVQDGRGQLAKADPVQIRDS
ncbi:hypothetical protein E2C01_047106 [Portunus trituberculatus]|uniref:Uncharacterized protein n=1 Tax=Portunus trituberculatus TaxID=210409 RepID=A0A5B7G6M6_PORTR|nr:hypothetical protein [Portunus trituberculatus]